MRLYLAGIYTSNFNLNGRLFNRLTEAEKKHRVDIEYYLESYHYIFRKSFVAKIRNDKKKVFLDSGAFSAFTKGVEVDLPGYCRYIKDNEDIIDVASVLDGIGDPLLTYQNQKAMEKLGVTPLPCFHYGEDERFLEYYIANYEYITLGGMVPISTPQLKLWLDRIWNDYLIDGSGNPRLKVHGFGLTTYSLIKDYPWYSVDSSAWVQQAASGMVSFPGTGTLNVSTQSSFKKKENQHYDNMTPIVQAKLREFMEAPGFDVEDLRTKYLSRWVFNIWAFEEMSRIVNRERKQFREEQMRLY